MQTNQEVDQIQNVMNGVLCVITAGAFLTAGLCALNFMWFEACLLTCTAILSLAVLELNSAEKRGNQ